MIGHMIPANPAILLCSIFHDDRNVPIATNAQRRGSRKVPAPQCNKARSGGI
jgi:hypothetical protein